MVVKFVNSNCWYDACGLECHQRNAREINTFRGCIPTLARIEQAISEAQRKSRFIKTCVRGSAFVEDEHLFDGNFEQLYDKRWFAVLRFLRKMTGILWHMKQCWSPALYVVGHSGADGQDLVADDDFRVSSITQALSDFTFLDGYTKMVLMLDDIAAKLGAWAEGCECHEEELVEKARKVKRRRKNFKKNQPFHHRIQHRREQHECKRKGKRPPELATGKLHAYLKETVQAAYAELMQTVRPHCTEADWQKIEADWRFGVAHLTTELVQKLAFWQRLPWKLAGMGVTPESGAKACAQVCIDIYDASVVLAGEDSHHRKTNQMLSKTGSFRPQIDLWLSEVSLGLLPDLKSEITALANIPVVERIIEARGSDVTTALKAGTVGIGRVSSELRLPEIEARCENDTENFDGLMQAYNEVRHVKRIPELFGFAMHPEILEFQSKYPNARRGKWLPLIRKILLHADLTSQFQQYAEADADHKTLAKEEEKACKAQLKLLAGPAGTKKLNADTIKREAFRRHCSDIFQPKGVFSMPALKDASGDLNTLQQATNISCVDREMFGPVVDDAQQVSHVSTELDNTMFFVVIDTTLTTGKYLKAAPGLGGLTSTQETCQSLCSNRRMRLPVFPLGHSQF